MSEQTSRLAIILDSTKAKQNSDTLATSLERLTAQGEKATGSTDELGFSFKRLATSAAGALSIGIVIKTLDEWGQVAARMKNALRSVEGDIKNYSAIQERFLTISNRNGKDIADTQLLYIGAATAMQELGYSTTQTVDYIESLSSAMTANASSANEVLSMQNALNKSMVAGRVAGENWNSIMNATPTLLGDIAKQLEKQNGGIKVTEMEVKKLAADGKISFKLFADAVMAAKEANNALADSMDNTFADGLTRITNSVKAYYGEMNQSLGITRSMSAGLATVSDNFDEVATTLTALVGIGAARYVGNLSTSIYDNTRKLADNAISNRKLAVDKINAARATLIQAQNEKAAALAAIESTKAQQAAATTEVQRISLKAQLANQTAVLTAATKAETLATNELTAAKNRASIASNLLKSSLNLIGGPLGAAMFAAGGMYAWYESTKQAKEEARNFSHEIPELVSNLEKLNRVQAEGAKVKLTQNIRQLKEDAIDAKKEVESLTKDLEWQKGMTSLAGSEWAKKEGLEKERDLTEKLTLKRAELDSITTKLSYSEESLGKVNSFLSLKALEQMQAARQQQDALDTLEPKVKLLSDAQAFLAQKLGITTNAMKQFNAQSLLLNYGGEDANKLIEGMKQQVELSKVAGKARAQLAAEQAAKRAGANGDGIKEARELAGIEYDNLEKQRELNKTSTYSESAAQKRLSSIQEQNAALKLQSEISDKLGTQQQALVKWNQEIKDIEDKQAKGKLTADQKSLLANKALITAELERAAEYEKIIQRKEAEVKIAAYNKQLMEETAQAQRAYNMELQGAGMGNLARGRLQEKLRLEEEYQKKQAALTAQYNDASSGITQEMYEKETQIIKGELDKRILMMQGYHAEQDSLRQNWQIGVQEALRNYIDSSKDYSQQANDIITNNLNTLTDGLSNSFTNMLTGTQSFTESLRNMSADLAKSIINDLIKIAIQAAITNSLTGFFGGGSGGSVSIFNAGLKGLGFANGGLVEGFAGGGYTGRGGKYDPRGVVHAGEFVFTKEATEKIGVPNLYKMMNTGSIPMDALKNDQYAMKNIHPANQTTNNSNQESNTQIIHVNPAPITVNGNPDDRTIAQLQATQKEAVKQAINEMTDQLERARGKFGKTMHGLYPNRKLQK